MKYTHLGDYDMSLTAYTLPTKLLCIELVTGNCKLPTAFMASDINRTAVALAG